MPIQKLYTNLQGFLGFSCNVCIKRRMQTLVRMKYSRAEHVPNGFMGLRTVERKPKQRCNLSYTGFRVGAQDMGRRRRVSCKGPLFLKLRTSEMESVRHSGTSQRLERTPRTPPPLPRLRVILLFVTCDNCFARILFLDLICTGKVITEGIEQKIIYGVFRQIEKQDKFTREKTQKRLHVLP